MSFTSRCACLRRAATPPGSTCATARRTASACRAGVRPGALASTLSSTRRARSRDSAAVSSAILTALYQDRSPAQTARRVAGSRVCRATHTSTRSVAVRDPIPSAGPISAATRSRALISPTVLVVCSSCRTARAICPSITLRERDARWASSMKSIGSSSSSGRSTGGTSGSGQSSSRHPCSSSCRICRTYVRTQRKSTAAPTFGQICGQPPPTINRRQKMWKPTRCPARLIDMTLTDDRTDHGIDARPTDTGGGRPPTTRGVLIALASVALLIVFLALVVGGGSSNRGSKALNSATSPASNPRGTFGGSAGGGTAGGGTAAQTVPVPAAPGAGLTGGVADSGTTASGSAGAAVGAGGPAVQAAPNIPAAPVDSVTKIVKTGEIDLQVDKHQVPHTIDKLIALAKLENGFVSDSHSSEGASPSGSVTLRVPVQS